MLHWIFLPLGTPGILHWQAAPCCLEGLGLFPFPKPVLRGPLCPGKGSSGCFAYASLFPGSGPETLGQQQFTLLCPLPQLPVTGSN